MQNDTLKVLHHFQLLFMVSHYFILVLNEYSLNSVLRCCWCIMITGRQIRAARSLLDWSAAELAQKAGLSRVTIEKIEKGMVEPRASNIAAILDVLDTNGIEFNGERGVAFKDHQVVTLKGENIFFRLLDDVIATLMRRKCVRWCSDGRC